jgi:hypothetical protein
MLKEEGRRFDAPLLARGMSNRQTAEPLVVTPKT